MNPTLQLQYISVRDYMAIEFAKVLIPNFRYERLSDALQQIPYKAYMYADALIKESKENTNANN